MSADDDEMARVVVEMPARGQHPPFTGEDAAVMARRKAEVDREKRAELAIQRQKRAEAVLGDVTEVALEAAESAMVASKSNQELAEMQTRRMLKVMLFGGEGFMPTSPREAMELANIASQISLREVQKVRGRAGDEDATPVQLDAQQIAKQMKDMRRKLKGVAG